VIVFGALAAVAFAPQAFAAPAPAGYCVGDNGYTAHCPSNGSSPNFAQPAVRGPVGHLPTVQGVPCTGEHLGVCVALGRGATVP
jgi:hypothetical protein